MEERRYTTRVKFVTKAVIVQEGKDIWAEVNDLSLTGAMIRMKSEADVRENQPLDLELLISGTTTDTRICMNCTVVRKNGYDVGVRFDALDLDAFMFIKNVVIYNDGDDVKIMREYFDFVGSKRLH